ARETGEPVALIDGRACVKRFVVQIICQRLFHPPKNKWRNDAVNKRADHQPAEPDTRSKHVDRLDSRVIADQQVVDRVDDQVNAKTEQRDRRREKADLYTAMIAVREVIVWRPVAQINAYKHGRRRDQAERVL